MKTSTIFNSGDSMQILDSKYVYSPDVESVKRMTKSEPIELVTGITQRRYDLTPRPRLTNLTSNGQSVRHVTVLVFEPWF